METASNLINNGWMADKGEGGDRCKLLNIVYKRDEGSCGVPQSSTS